MFKLVDDVLWPENGKYRGFTQLEASEKAKQIILEKKDKIYPGWLKRKPWLFCPVVMDIIDNENGFKAMADRGDLKTGAGVDGYEWAVTN